MKALRILLVLSLAVFVSCSGSKKKADKEEGLEEVAMEEGSEDADFIVDADEEEIEGEEMEEVADAGDEEEILEDSDIEEVVSSDNSIEMGDQVGSYTVKKGDTMMLIAFKLYGDYTKWKDVRDLNGLSSSDVSPGMELRYRMPQQAFVWNPEGLPYLIKVGDSLITISQDKYGTQGRWRDLYNNNRPMIKDPNLIFAGFTLYYIPDRDVASE